MIALDQQQQLTESDSRINNSNLSALQQRPRKIKRDNRIKIDLARTQYPLLRTVAISELGWRVWTREESKEEISLYWFDTYVNDEFVRKVRPYQRVNHFPGSEYLGKKNLLANCLNRMKRMAERQYSFFPNTFNFPADIEDFEKYASCQEDRFYIVKPCSDSQGRGIFLTRRPDTTSKEEMVVQEYLENPCLIEKSKFDLRLYILLRSIAPLKIYVYEEGLCRLATCDYEKPLSSNQKNMRMHLTNYAINKLSPNFVFNKSEVQDNVGHKRSYRSSMKTLEGMGCDIVSLQKQIDRIIIKTLIGVHSTISKRYKDARDTREEMESVCFQILGFDILIDQEFKPYLLEVNHSPSFSAETPLDMIIKKNLLLDTLNILNLSHEDKINYLKSRNEQDNIHSQQIMKTYIKHQVRDADPEETGAFRKIYPLEATVQHQEANRMYERLFKLSKVQRISPSKCLGPLNRGIPFANEKVDKIRDTADSVTQKDAHPLSFYSVLHNLKHTKLKQLKQAIEFQQLLPTKVEVCQKNSIQGQNSLDASLEDLQRLQKEEVLIYQSKIRRDRQKQRRKYICPVPVNSINIRLDDRFSHRVKDNKQNTSDMQTTETKFKIHSMFNTAVERKKHREEGNRTTSNWLREEVSNEEKFRATDRLIGKISYSIELKQKIERMQMARLRIQRVRKVEKNSCVLIQRPSPQK